MADSLPHRERTPWARSASLLSFVFLFLTIGHFPCGDCVCLSILSSPSAGSGKVRCSLPDAVEALFTGGMCFVAILVFLRDFTQYAYIAGEGSIRVLADFVSTLFVLAESAKDWRWLILGTLGYGLKPRGLVVARRFGPLFPRSRESWRHYWQCHPVLAPIHFLLGISSFQWHVPGVCCLSFKS